VEHLVAVCSKFEVSLTLRNFDDILMLILLCGDDEKYVATEKKNCFRISHNSFPPGTKLGREHWCEHDRRNASGSLAGMGACHDWCVKFPDSVTVKPSHSCIASLPRLLLISDAVSTSVLILRFSRIR
jgi:hypothetical protein